MRSDPTADDGEGSADAVLYTLPAIVYRASTMNDSRMIWRLGRWVARQRTGRARLGARDLVFEITLHDGLIVGLTGLSPASLADELGCEPANSDDLVIEARKLVEAHGIPETTAMAAVKKVVQEALSRWLTDADRTLELFDEVPPTEGAGSISATHALVELVLSSPDETVIREILPRHDILLRRTDGFLDLYAPLGLAEEADLIVAKITGQRTADEIASRSPHERDEVIRLLAALTVSGLLEAVEAVPPRADPKPVERHGDSIRPDRDPGGIRRVKPWMILTVIALLATISVGAWFLLRPDDPSVEAVEDSPGHWAIAVDLGCEPHEYRRLLQVARKHDSVRPIAVTADESTGDDTCWRLVWGDFSTQSAALDAMDSVPPDVLREGFEPHVVEVDDTAKTPAEEP